MSRFKEQKLPKHFHFKVLNFCIIFKPNPVVSMNWRVTFVLLSFCVGCLSSTRIDLALDQSVTDQSVILGTIIINYLRNHFSDENIYISIIILPFKKEQNQIWRNFHNYFIDNIVVDGFAYNILNNLDSTARDNWNPFHLIFVDDISAIK